MAKKQHFDTLQLHAGQTADPATGACAVPIYQTTSYVFDSCDHAAALFELKESGNIYTRIMNPTTAVLEERVNALEGGVGAVAFASGMAAITAAVMAIAGAGDHLVSANSLYGGTHTLFTHALPKLGITSTLTDPDDLTALEAAIKPNTKAVYIETLGNPNCNIMDIEKVADIAHRHSIPLICDSTFSPPCLFRPFTWGADIVVHSATKFLGGHGTSVGGIVVDGGTFDWAASGKFPGLSQPDPAYHDLCYTDACGKAAFATKVRVVTLRDTGACLSPFNAFLLLQGIETLSLRVERHIFNTRKVLKYLESCPYVEKVNHPEAQGSPYAALAKKYFPKGAGSIFTITVKGTREQAKKFIDSLELVTLLANVADARSLAIHPASTTHSQMNKAELQAAGIEETTIRLSIGLEYYGDIIADFKQAFRKAYK